MDAIRNLLDSDEQPEIISRKHWISLVLPLLSSALLALISLIGLSYVTIHQNELAASGRLLFASIAIAALLLLAFVLVVANLRIYQATQLILTNKSLYLVLQNSLISRKITQFGLGQLENVTARQNGFLAQLLNYGEVNVETAGEQDNIRFSPVANPEQLGDQISDVQSHAKSE